MEEPSALGRWSAGLLALLDAGISCEKVAAALLVLVPAAVGSECQLDGVAASAGQPGAEGILVRSAVEAAGKSRGQLSVRVPGEGEGYQPVLALAARLVALQLPDRLAQDPQALELLTVGEAAGSLIHSINNHLNVMVLQAACAQMQAGPPVREQAEQIRREGARAAERMRCLQAIRPWPARDGERVDLIAAIRRVLREEPQMHRVEAHFPAGQMLVPASAMGMQRMLTQLLRVAVRCMPGEKKVRVEVGRTEGVTLTVRLPGVAYHREEDCLGLPPEPQGGLHQLEREAARWLLRQMGSYLETTHDAEGAVVTVRWEGA
jgi:hypothetical protein